MFSRVFGCAIFGFSYLRRPPPRPKPPPRDPKLEEPRLPLERALDPLYPRVPPPKASRFPPPLREKSRLPIRSLPPPFMRLLTPAPPPRLPIPPLLLRFPKPPPSPKRLLDKFPPCRPICCRALDCRLAKESPRAVPPNRSAVARSR